MENEPLLPLTINPNPTPLQRFKNTMQKKKILIPVLTLSLLTVSYLIVYLLVMPRVVQNALNGQGSLLYSVHVTSLDPLISEIKLQIPFESKTMARAEVNLGSLELKSGDTVIGQLSMDILQIPRKQTSVWFNSTATPSSLNMPWIAWTINQGVKHGFQQLAIDL